VKWLTILGASSCLSLGLIGCGDGKGLEPVEIVSSQEGTNSETAASIDGDWPECLPWSVSGSSFVVGPDALWGLYDPDTNWPAGHHDAICVVDSTSVEPPTDGAMQIGIHLRECQDELMQPVALSLDLVFHSSVFVEPPPGVEVDRSVRVSYSVTTWDEGVHQAWYSLRDAETDELLLAAFADFGPSVVPKVDGELDLESWLAPFEATLDRFGCAPEANVGCSDGAAQRSFVEFTRDGSAWDVLGGTEGDLGDYRVYLGFAGTPGYCEGKPTHHAIGGIVARKL
jgi:hypothetical protein